MNIFRITLSVMVLSLALAAARPEVKKYEDPQGHYSLEVPLEYWPVRSGGPQTIAFGNSAVGLKVIFLPGLGDVIRIYQAAEKQLLKDYPKDPVLMGIIHQETIDGRPARWAIYDNILELSSDIEIINLAGAMSLGDDGLVFIGMTGQANSSSEKKSLETVFRSIRSSLPRGEVITAGAASLQLPPGWSRLEQGGLVVLYPNAVQAAGRCDLLIPAPESIKDNMTNWFESAWAALHVHFQILAEVPVKVYSGRGQEGRFTGGVLKDASGATHSFAFFAASKGAVVQPAVFVAQENILFDRYMEKVTGILNSVTIVTTWAKRARYALADGGWAALFSKR